MTQNDAGHDRSQLGAYVLDALEPEEAREVEQHLAGCAECQAEVAELEELKGYLGEVPPEAFLDGPPPDGDLMLQRTLREVRLAAEVEQAEASQAAVVGETSQAAVADRAEPGEPLAPGGAARGVPAKRLWLLVAAAIVLITGAVGGGVLIGQQTAEPVAESVPPAGSKVVRATDTTTGTTMQTTVEPRAGWSWIVVNISGLDAGAECQMLVTDRTGKTWVAGSWVVSPKAAKEGSRFGGGVLVPLDQVKSVEIRTLQGEHVVTTQV